MLKAFVGLQAIKRSAKDFYTNLDTAAFTRLMSAGVNIVGKLEWKRRPVRVPIRWMAITLSPLATGSFASGPGSPCAGVDRKFRAGRAHIALCLFRVCGLAV
jgi:hypothetical protein